MYKVFQWIIFLNILNSISSMSGMGISMSSFQMMKISEKTADMEGKPIYITKSGHVHYP